MNIHEKILRDWVKLPTLEMSGKEIDALDALFIDLRQLRDERDEARSDRNKFELKIEQMTHDLTGVQATLDAARSDLRELREKSGHVPLSLDDFMKCGLNGFAVKLLGESFKPFMARSKDQSPVRFEFDGVDYTLGLARPRGEK